MELLFSLGGLFFLGAAHGLEPGHGKLIVTGYLTGSQAKVKDAFVLGLLVAFFHTLSVACIGAIVVFLAFTFFKDSYLNSLQIISGAVILILGSILFYKRFINPSKHKDHCECHIVHEPNAKQEVSIKNSSSFKEVVLLGFASGLSPCPIALTALIAAFTMGQIYSALGALAIFSLGIGSVLVILGLILIRGTGALSHKWERYKDAPIWIAKGSTIFVLLLGCYLVSKPFLAPEEKPHQEEALNFLMPTSTHR